MTTYRLPDGAEVRAADSNLANVQTLANHAWVIHPTLGAISCYTGLLMPVLPPLPPEPPIGTVILDGGDRAWQRVRDDRDPQWRHDSLMCSWETMVRENGPLTPMVPDPAANAPELPWGCDDAEDDGDRLSIEPARRTDLAAFIKTSEDGVRLTAADARQAAAALLRAAREVERP